MNKKTKEKIGHRQEALRALRAKHPQICLSCNGPITKNSSILNYRAKWLHADCARTQMKVDLAIERDDEVTDRRTAHSAYLARKQKRRTA